MAEILAADRPRIAHVLQLIEQYAPTGPLRALDLACRTGAFSVAVGGQGIKVLGIEGRQDNLDEAPRHPNVTYELADVRTLSRERHGIFDVVLCLGLLYHLDAQSALNLLRVMAEVTTGIAILDTHISCNGTDVTEVEGHTFSGHAYPEPDGLWSSIGYAASWWFTPPSLQELTALAGWDLRSVPKPEGVAADRCWYLLQKTEGR
jgi:hypothetical protein